jgi:hypothetical protein
MTRSVHEKTALAPWPRLEFLEPLFAVIGAVGLRLYAPERATRDMDVMVAVGDFEQAERRLTDAGWESVGKLSVGGSAWRLGDGQEIVLYFRREQWWPDLIAEAQSNRDEQGLPVMPLRGQVWLKLVAGRSIDADDLSRLLGLATESQLTEIRQFLEEYADQRDVQDFDSLVQLGKLEFREPS